MTELVKQIENIDFKIKQLARKIELLKEENHHLVKENTELREMLKQKSAGTRQAEFAFDVAEGLNEQAKDKLKKELDTYIQTIDDCIVMLNNM